MIFAKIAKITWCTIAVIWLASCGGGSDNSSVESSWFSEERSYLNLIHPFETEQECLDAQNPNFFINCYKIVDFYPDGTATVMLTDILNNATYSIEDMFITVTLAPNSEVAEIIEFYVSDDYKSLIQASNSEVWSIEE